MNCPKCGHEISRRRKRCEVCGQDTTVFVTYSESDTVVRQRKCVSCGHIFYTQEIDMSKEDAKKFISDYRRRNING